MTAGETVISLQGQTSREPRARWKKSFAKNVNEDGSPVVKQGRSAGCCLLGKNQEVAGGEQRSIHFTVMSVQPTLGLRMNKLMPYQQTEDGFE